MKNSYCFYYCVLHHIPKNNRKQISNPIQKATISCFIDIDTPVSDYLVFPNQVAEIIGFGVSEEAFEEQELRGEGKEGGPEGGGWT